MTGMRLTPSWPSFCFQYLAVKTPDVSNRALFVSRYGPTYYSFAYHGDLFIVLDGELDACNISVSGSAFLREALDGSEARNVFVFVHKLIWVVDGTPYYVLRAPAQRARRI